jgi:hypothetical protein
MRMAMRTVTVTVTVKGMRMGMGMQNLTRKLMATVRQILMGKQMGVHRPLHCSSVIPKWPDTMPRRRQPLL